jgi:hypothetical protein
VRRFIAGIALLTAWPILAGASSGIYARPEAVVVKSGTMLLVARSDPGDEGWQSLCVESPDGALEFPVGELDRLGSLSDSSLRWESSAGAVVDDSKEPVPVPGREDGLVELPLRWMRVASLQFHVAKDRGDEPGNVDYWRVKLVVTWNEGSGLKPLAGVEAMPTERDGTPLPDVESTLSEMPVSFRAGGRCRLPDLRD